MEFLQMKITEKYVFFWTGQDIYSNFYYEPFKHQEKLFKWAEQAIMYRKAKLFGAHHVAEKILQANSPNECKKLGRSRDIPFDEKVWDKNKLRIFKEILLDKFKDPKLLAQMKSTGKRKFVEASPYDKIWGVGMRSDNPDILDESKWKGQNLLGKVLDDVKKELTFK